MKTIIVLLFVLTFGATALANSAMDVKVNGIEMGIVLDASADTFSTFPQMEIGNEFQIARLYKFQNARITKALKFVTKKTSAKLV